MQIKFLPELSLSVRKKTGSSSVIAHVLRRAFARLDEIQTEISLSSDESVVLNIRPLVELTARREKKKTHIQTPGLSVGSFILQGGRNM